MLSFTMKRLGALIPVLLGMAFIVFMMNAGRRGNLALLGSND